MNFEILNLRMFFYTEKRECQKFHKKSFLLTRLYVFPNFSLSKYHFYQQGYILYQTSFKNIKLCLFTIYYNRVLREGVLSSERSPVRDLNQPFYCEVPNYSFGLSVCLSVKSFFFCNFFFFNFFFWNLFFCIFFLNVCLFFCF